MRIPKNLKHLWNRKGDALLLITGKQDAVIYKASKGTLEKLDTFKMPFFSERELIKDFMSELLVHLKNIKAEKFTNIYLFVPSYVKDQVMKAIPTELRKHIKAVVEGNYFHLAPAELMLRLA